MCASACVWGGGWGGATTAEWGLSPPPTNMHSVSKGGVGRVKRGRVEYMHGMLLLLLLLLLGRA